MYKSQPSFYQSIVVSDSDSSTNQACLASTVPTDGTKPLGARASAGTVKIKSLSCIFM